MNKRIKIIYLLTIFGILAFCGLEGYWLYQQYDSYLSVTALDMYMEVVKIADGAVDKQILKEDKNLHAIYRMNNVSKADSMFYSGYIVILDIDTQIDTESTKKLTEQIDSGIIPPGVKDVFPFGDIEAGNSSNKDFQEAINRFRVNKTVPFCPDSLTADVVNRLGVACHSELVHETPNRLWQPKVTLPKSVYDPQLNVLYPYNPIEGGAVNITVDIPIGGTIKDMALTLVVALGVAIMLITCLVLQIKTIRRQQKIADFQKGYTLTMLHELKRPIGALKLFISFMRNPRLNDADRQEALDNGAKEVDNLASYFEKLRAITYSEAYDSPLSLTTFDLAEAAKECATQGGQASSLCITVHSDGKCCDVSNGSWKLPVLVTAERQSIDNVLANLIENAVKYSPTNSPIDIEIKKEEDSVSFSVADHGCGISDADKARIFDRFFRAGDHKDIPGIGLGLAYVQQVVSAHGGEISVTDRDGGGTVFTIKLPQ